MLITPAERARREDEVARTSGGPAEDAVGAIGNCSDADCEPGRCSLATVERSAGSGLPSVWPPGGAEEEESG
jgi:hypothetical protein